MSQLMLDQALQIAVGHHQQGRFAEAQQIYRQILAQVPQHADALHLLGVTYGQTGNPQAAVETIRKALALVPKQHVFLSNLGKFLLDAGQTRDSIDACRKSIRAMSTFADAHNNLGNALKAKGEIEPAIAEFREAIRLNPNYGEAYSNLGNALTDSGKFDEAITACRRAILLRPTFAQAHNNLGHALERLEDHAGAEAACREAVRLNPNLHQARNNLAIALVGLERYEEAEAEAREALRVKPNFAEAYNTLGTAMNGQKRHEEAIEYCSKALELKGDFADAQNAMGTALFEAGKYTEAIAAYRAAMKLDGDNRQAEGNLSGVLNTVGEYEEAFKLSQDAVVRRPFVAETHFNLSMMLLARGDLKRGLEEYEWRLKNKDSKHRTFTEPKWRGEELGGKRILIHNEQGLGDALQFVRYAKLIKARGGHVIVESPVPLRKLFETVPGIDELVNMGDPLPPFDVQISHMSVMHAMGTVLETIPGEVPYITPDPEIVAHWRERTDGVKGLKVGLAWAGSKLHQGDKIRSMKLAEFAPVAAVPGVKLFSLQKGEPAEQVKDASFEIIDWTGEFNDFSDTAGLIKNLDLVIAVDTSVCHLAGALGHRTWVMLAFANEWRWLMDREDSPWYPTMRLFRQPRVKDWAGAVEKVVGEIGKLV